MGNSVHVTYGYGFVTESPEEEDFSEVFTAMGIEVDPEEPYEAWDEMEQKFPDISVNPFGHYDYYYGYFICAKSTERNGWSAKLNLGEPAPVPTMDEVTTLSSLLGYFYPNFDGKLDYMVVGSYS